MITQARLNHHIWILILTKKRRLCAWRFRSCCFCLIKVGSFACVAEWNKNLWLYRRSSFCGAYAVRRTLYAVRRTPYADVDEIKPETAWRTFIRVSSSLTIIFWKENLRATTRLLFSSILSLITNLNVLERSLKIFLQSFVVNFLSRIIKHVCMYLFDEKILSV